MISDSTFPQRFTKVDDLTRPDHPYLTEDDACYFIGEYTTGGGWGHSATNSLIFNLKKGMERRQERDWHWKAAAIQQAAAAFRKALGQRMLDCWTFVPIPPSKVRGDALYDDRLTQMLRAIRPDSRLDIRELIVQRVSTDPVHESDERPLPSQIQSLYEIDEALTEPAPAAIAIVDDMLTAGAHFRAAMSVLSERFSTVKIRGLFIARRVPNTSGQIYDGC